VIADALHALKASDPGRLETLSNTARIVTFGGRIKMPDAFTDITDVVGELDWFGELNSRPKIATDIRVPYCGHSTNTDLPGAIKVTKIIEDILAGHAPQAVEIVEPVSPAAPETVNEVEAIAEDVVEVAAEPIAALAVEPVEEAVDTATATEPPPEPASVPAPEEPPAIEAVAAPEPDAGTPVSVVPDLPAPGTNGKTPAKTGPKKARARR
jgi:hypothetical protein